MTFLTIAIFFVLSFFGSVQPDSISLDYCYQQAYEHYPTAKNVELQKKITELNVHIANTGYFPDITINGQATYQSEVTEIGLSGGGGLPSISKDQYEGSVDVTQTIFNGGAVEIQKELERAKGEQQMHATEVNLQQIRSQIDQVYFGILLSQQQAKTINLLIENLEEQLSAVRSQVENGVLLPSQQHILKAELISARQDSIDNHSNIKAGYEVLSEIIGEEIIPKAKLVLPKEQPGYQSLHPQRAELNLFESRRQTLEQQRKLVRTKQMPSLAAFGTAAYGRPGLNFLNDDFHDYYIAGVKVRWNVWDFFNADREQQILKIEQQKIDHEQRAFQRQLNASLDRISEHIGSIKENMKRDREIIELRQQVVKESASQLKNGVITATEYVMELTRANQARLSLYINRVRLSQAKVEYLTTLGIPADGIR
ncbi:TolC family protein [Aliifodinibius salicampi]|uniref:TolC family protein n=1 Tax=Fodinibius salicampi TaxID=1920655 RepID=A0ABT3Q1S3_9BACT|nr:TolC family protein [Fodinibius salicampi]MCW9714057.1 TolC family protein [Fodinibius salicampi]